MSVEIGVHRLPCGEPTRLDLPPLSAKLRSGQATNRVRTLFGGPGGPGGPVTRYDDARPAGITRPRSRSRNKEFSR